MAPIPKVRAWRLTFENGERFLVWGPTKYLAKLNFLNSNMWKGLPALKTIGRCTSADDRPVPKSLVERI